MKSYCNLNKNVVLLISYVFHIGLKGWWELKLPSYFIEKDLTAGGIELSMKFNKNSDRQHVIDTGRGMEWIPAINFELTDEAWLHPTMDNEDMHSVFNFHCDLVVFPKNVIDQTLSKYKDAKQHYGTLYCRYKFYNKGF